MKDMKVVEYIPIEAREITNSILDGRGPERRAPAIGLHGTYHHPVRELDLEGVVRGELMCRLWYLG